MEESPIYLPLDISPNSGSTFIEDYDIHTDRPTDFLIEIDGKENSRVWIQERYNATQTIHSKELNRIFDRYENAPAKDSPVFQPIELILNELDYYDENGQIPFSEVELANEKHYSLAQTYETGKLIHGNGNPDSKDFNSLTDFSFGEGLLEIRLPWSLLNFSNPTKMQIHKDYYEEYGVEDLSIDEIYLGVGSGQKEIQMKEFDLEGLGKNPDYHERLKESYYILQEHWQNQ